jgi:O-succinylbenzoic acid--CoA ligase
MVTEFNPGFSVNGLHVAFDDLSEVAYSMVKEGEPYEREIGDFLLDWVSESPDILQHTSGTTGAPREISLSKEAMVRSARLTGEVLGLGEGTRAVLCLPVSSIAGKMMLVRALVLGWNLTIVPPERNPLWALAGHIDFTAMVPMQLEASLKDLDRVGMVLVGGAPLPESLLQAVAGRKTVVYESYGMSETASHIALRKHNPRAEGAEGSPPPFKALPGVQLQQDDRGCLVVQAPFIPGDPIHTNDLVSLEGPDAFRWLGRADNAVNSGGVKLLPEVLESRLQPIVGRRFFLTGMPDGTLGEKLVLVAEGGADEDLLSKVSASGVLEKYETPKAVYFVDSFKQTRSGKISRREITDELFKNS